MGKPDWLSFRATRRVLGLAMLRQTFWASAGVASSRSAMCSFLLSLTGFDVRGGGTPMENAPAAAITAQSECRRVSLPAMQNPMHGCPA
jgi:hypothetical protein